MTLRLARSVPVLLIGIAVGIALGASGGWFLARRADRGAVLCGPYSDNYGPALAAIARAREALPPGDGKAAAELDEAEAQIRSAQAWARGFIDGKSCAR